MNVPVKPTDNWSGGIGRRLLVEASFESFHPTLSLEMEVSSTIVEQESPRNPLRFYDSCLRLSAWACAVSSVGRRCQREIGTHFSL
ncbi:unnamed protein product [Protopolystoma xenopodis]|uniref:Uncharacterized protein n=1 Tax=Protopolystoma xenopodis TaxID=117903 RepID=A0A3S5CIW0_9PLAT|nr:unnamed protein product [Protopolystoma xenopodis]